MNRFEVIPSFKRNKPLFQKGLRMLGIGIGVMVTVSVVAFIPTVKPLLPVVAVIALEIVGLILAAIGGRILTEEHTPFMMDRAAAHKAMKNNIMEKYGRVHNWKSVRHYRIDGDTHLFKVWLNDDWTGDVQYPFSFDETGEPTLLTPNQSN